MKIIKPFIVTFFIFAIASCGADSKSSNGSNIPVTGVSLNKTSTSIFLSRTEQLAATIEPDNATNRSVTWASSDTSVASVSEDGFIGPESTGTATITATTVDGAYTAECALTVCSFPAFSVAVTDVILSKSSAKIVLGGTYQLTATILPASALNRDVTWTSSNTSVASVSGEGLVSASALGTAIITVTTESGGYTATCAVTVTKLIVIPIGGVDPDTHVTGLTLSDTSATLLAGKKKVLSATITPSTATNTDITWTSSDPDIAMVSGSGLVYAREAGTVTVTATSDDNDACSASCTVDVVTTSIDASVTTYKMSMSSEAFKIRLTPYAASEFTTGGLYDGSTAAIPDKFYIAQTETTYALWNEVYEWATSSERGTKRYTFANPGGMGCYKTGSDFNPVWHTFTESGYEQHPVTNINCRDAIIWCNALTEYYNAHKADSDPALDCVYYSDSTYYSPMRSSSNGETISTTPGTRDVPYIKSRTGTYGNTEMANCAAIGFRIPTGSEWEFAAKYIGDSIEPDVINCNYIAPYYYTKGRSASGQVQYTDWDSESFSLAVTSVAWHHGNSETSTGSGDQHTRAVGLLGSNKLGLFDMSGNVYEMTFDLTNSNGYEGSRTKRGGCVGSTFDYICVGTTANVNYPYKPLQYAGFRFVRSK